jgi:hypothetical protein
MDLAEYGVCGLDLCEDDYLLGCSAVSSVRSVPTFQRSLLLHHQGNEDLSSGHIALMMEAARTSETLEHFYQTTAIFVLTAVRTSNPTQIYVAQDRFQWPAGCCEHGNEP